MRRAILAMAAAVAAAGLAGEGRKRPEHAAYQEYKAGAIRPEGYLKEFLRRQAEGATGNRMKLGYPFNLRLWEGPMDEIYFTEGVYKGSDQKKEGTKEEFWRSGSWWPFEQSAYLLDGMIRVATLVDAPALEADYRKSFDWVMGNAAADGDLFTPLSNSGTQWPLVVFARSAWAYAEKNGCEEAVAKAFQRHFDANRGKRRGWTGRSMLSAECMLRTMEHTGDKSLLADALHIWKASPQYRDFGVKKRILDHGVSFCEYLKMPALLYIYTGDKELYERGKKAVRDAFELNEQADGQISANEFLSGRDPRQGHETCLLADMTWALGYYLQADGDLYCADRMERIAYNALPGSCTKDFRLHQYLSSVNQAFCTPFSQSAHFNYGESAWRQYRAAHFPQCCSGNINRAMPNYAARTWMREADGGAPVKMLYGPSRLSAEYKGVKFELEELDGGYPFGDAARIRYRGPKLRMPLRYRIPGWCARGDAGRMLTEEREWRDGDVFTIELPSKVVLKSDRNWHWFERGPITFAYATPGEPEKEDAADPYGALRIEPKGPWNYGFDVRALAGAELKVKFCESGYPFETPSMRLEVPVEEIKEWQTADHNRFMPDPPLFAHRTGRRTTIELVPYATTLGRITCFPDTVERKELPVVAAYTSGEAYELDEGKELWEQSFEPEGWDDLKFRNLYKVPQPDPDMFYSLYMRHGFEKGKVGYLLFRVWSDEAGEATFALGAASQCQAFIGGREVYRGLPFTEGKLMAPYWFRHRVEAGYNYVLVKCATPRKLTGQFRKEWGAKLRVFVER